jgi:single stranded DNA-binding protein
MTGSGTAVLEIILAVNRIHTRSDGTKIKSTLFMPIVCYGSRAEILANKARKGVTMLFAGHLETDKWVSKEGAPRERIRLVCDSFQFADKRDPSSGHENGTVDSYVDQDVLPGEDAEELDFRDR